MRKSTPSNSHGISRRTVLRGAGVTMALPWLESLHAFADTPTASAFPKRFAVLFMGNGVNEDHWSATGQGADMVLSKTLAPLEPIKHKINYIDGLFNKASTGQGIHPAMTGGLLSGAHIQTGAVVKSGISLDQLIANHLGADSPQQSIVLACEAPMTGYHETNFSLAYSSHISWQTPDSPVPVELYPSLAFDSLFENRGSLRNMSILDRVKDRAESLSKQISATDKTKLDEYLSSVREVETRVDRMRKTKDTADEAAKGANKPCLDDGSPGEWPAGRSARPRASDVRQYCDRIPDGQDTRSDAAAGTGSLGAVLSIPRCQGWTSRRIAQQQFGPIRAHLTFPSESTGVPGEEAGQHAGGRRHGAGPLLPDVPFEHVDRPQA